MKKRILSIALTLCMLLAIMPVTSITVMAATPKGTALTQDNISDYTTLKGGDSADTMAYFYLDDDVQINTSIKILGHVTLDLNGYVLKQTGDGHITVGTSLRNVGNLTLIDSNTAAVHYFTVDDTDGLWKLSDSATENLVYGGIITGGKATNSAVCSNAGGGIYVETYSSFTMNGGNIVGCTAELGGGVSINAYSTAFFSGGNIIGCTAVAGGGVFNRTNFFTMTDGTIKSCIATREGSGLYQNSGAVMYADGGTIEDEVMNKGVITRSESATGYTTFSGTVNNNGTIEDKVKLTVTFDSGVTEQKVLKGQKVTEPSAPKKDGYTFKGWYNGDTKYDFNAAITDNITLTAMWNDITPPVISGIEDGKTYCETQEVTVSDNDDISSVTVNGKLVTIKNGKFTLLSADGEQKIIVTDKADNKTEMTVTVNNGHTYEWQNESGQYWQKCSICNHETEKKDIPTITMTGADHVCKTQDYKFSFTLSENMTNISYGYAFENKGGEYKPTFENGVYYGVVYADDYAAEESAFTVIIEAYTADGFVVSVSREVTLQKEHSSGTADDNKSPQTGDNSYMALWFVLLFVSGGALIGTGIYGKKKRFVK